MKTNIIIDLALQWNDILSKPPRLGIFEGYPHQGIFDTYPSRNVNAPAYAECPEELKTHSWNISQSDLLGQAPDIMVYPQRAASRLLPPLTIVKEYNEQDVPTHFSGLPKNGLIGPGVLGAGVYDGKPAPISVAADIVILEQDKDTGAIYSYLGKRPEYCFAGGFADEGEQPIDAAIREFFEEVLVAAYDLGEYANEILADKDWRE